MSESRPTPALRVTGGDGKGVNSGLSSRPRPGLGHDLARWTLTHRRVVTALAVLGIVAFSGWQAWAAFQQVHAWTIKNGNGAVPSNRVDWPFTFWDEHPPPPPSRPRPGFLSSLRDLTGGHRLTSDESTGCFLSPCGLADR